MKRVLWLLIIILICPLCCHAYELATGISVQYQKKVEETGFRILNANDIPQRVTFYYDSDSSVKTSVNRKHKAVIVNKGLMRYIEDDNELAGVISKEIAYTEDAGKGLFKRVTMDSSPRKYDKKSDKKAVDYMVNAGYNPVAYINILNKCEQEKTPLKRFTTYNNSRRMMFVYEHIYEKYPMFLAKNEYLNNIYYQNFLHTSKHDRIKVRKSKEERLKQRKQRVERENINEK